MKRTLLLAALAAAMCLPTAASANDYLKLSKNDWLRYVDSRGNEKVVTIAQTAGTWKMWSDFAGQGPTWIWAAPETDNYFWIWADGDYDLITNFDASVGAGKQIRWNSCNSGAAWVGSKGSIKVGAGDFSDAVELKFQASCADAGLSSVWFARGVGIVQWTEQSFAGPVTWTLAAGSIGGATYPKVTAPQPNPTNDRAVAASEHDTMETILWGCNDTYLVIPTYTDAFRALHNSGVKVQVVVDSNSVASELRYELNRNNVPMGNVEIIVAALDSVWMRDYGPIVLKKPDGTRVVADPDYYYGRPQDDDFPIAYANFRGWQRVHMDLSYEGGNFATDGNGTAMCSTGVEYFNNRLSRSQIERRFEVLGCDDVVWFEPLIDEGTTHIDMFARVMSDNVALVSRYPSSHRQSRVCNDAASTFQRLGYQVLRADAAYGYDEFATYSNSVLANGIALIPTYGRSQDSGALAAYRQAGYNAVAIDSRLIIKYSGATHCLSMQIPAGK